MGGAASATTSFSNSGSASDKYLSKYYLVMARAESEHGFEAAVVDAGGERLSVHCRRGTQHDYLQAKRGYVPSVISASVGECRESGRPELSSVAPGQQSRHSLNIDRQSLSRVVEPSHAKAYRSQPVVQPPEEVRVR